MLQQYRHDERAVYIPGTGYTENSNQRGGLNMVYSPTLLTKPSLTHSYHCAADHDRSLRHSRALLLF